MDKATLIMLGDIHMSNSLPYAVPTSDGLTDRFKDQLRLFESVEKYANKYEADGIMILGDLFDKRLLDPITLVETVKAIRALAESFPVYILPGNHEANTRAGGRFSVEVFQAIEGCEVLGLETFRKRPWLRFYTLPYASVEENLEGLERLREMRDGKGREVTNVLLFHNSVVGCKHLAWLCDDGIQAEVLCEGWDYVIGGHFHSHQTFGSDGRGCYLGAPMQHHFADRDDRRGIWKVTFNEDGTREMKRIRPKGMPTFHLREVTEAEADIDTGGIVDGDYLRVEVKATQPEWMRVKDHLQDFIDQCLEMGIRAELKHKPVYHHDVRISEGDASDLFDFDSLLTSYVKSDDVVIGELDEKKLVRLGRELLRDANEIIGSSLWTATGSEVTGLTQIKINDFCCFEDVDLNLNDQGLVYIRGDNRDTSGATSNGAGKTSIFKAVSWVLYDECVDGDTGDKIIRRGTKQAKVELILRDEDSDTVIRIERTRRPSKPGLIVEVNGEPIEKTRKELNDEIVKRVGLDFHAFKNTALYGANDIFKFSDPRTKDADRKSMIHRILRTEQRITLCLRLARDRATETRKKYEERRTRIDSIESVIDSLKLKELRARVKKWSAARNEQVEELKLKAKEKRDEASEVEHDDSEVLKIERDVREMEDELSSLPEPPTEDDVEAMALVIGETKTKLKGLQERAMKLTAKVQTLEDNFDSLSDKERCPVCNSRMDEGDAADHLLKVEQELNDFREERDKTYDEAKALKAGLKGLVKSYDEAQSSLSYSLRLSDSINRAMMKLRAAKAEADVASGKRAKIIEDAKRYLERAKEKAKEENPYTAMYKEARERDRELRESLAEEKGAATTLGDELMYLKFWVKGFSNQGLPSFILDSIMPFLTERANEYLDVLSDGDISMGFSTQRALKSSKDEVRDEIDISWTIEGNEGVTPSSGQRTRMNLATDLALMDLVAHREGSRMNILMLDEVLDGMDAEGTNRVLELLQDLRSRIGSVYVISHQEGMSEIFEKGMTVVREGGVSRIEAS